MKKILTILILIIMLFNFSSCFNRQEEKPRAYDKLYCADPNYSNYFLRIEGVYERSRYGEYNQEPLSAIVHIYDSEENYETENPIKSKEISLTYEYKEGFLYDDRTDILTGTTNDDSMWLRLFEGSRTSNDIKCFFSIVSIRGIIDDNPSRYFIFYTAEDEKIQYIEEENDEFVYATFVNYDGEFLHKQCINVGFDIEYSGPRPIKKPSLSTSYLFNGWELLSDGKTYKATYKELLMSDLVSYNLDDKTDKYTVKARDNFNATDIKISNTYQGKAVVGIEENGFKGCSSLRKIEIPENVQMIGSSAFSDCYNLETIDGEEFATWIGSSAFMNCTSLKTITINNRITTLPASLFSGCSSLTDVNWDIGYLFNESKSGFPVLIDNSVAIIISKNCFTNCTSLKTLKFDKYITKIESYAFKGCSSLRYLILQNGISIGVAVFHSTSLDAYVLGDKISPMSGWLSDWSGNIRYYKEPVDDDNIISFENEIKYWFYLDGMPFGY